MQQQRYLCATRLLQSRRIMSTIAKLPKSNTFTQRLPPDSNFPTPISSHRASRDDLGPRTVKGALFTYVRPETCDTFENLGMGTAALHDLGLHDTERDSEELKAVVSGNKLYWNVETESGIYPWAQCYGGWQFGSWAGQLGDGRAISLFEATNPDTKVRYEVQLKGAGMTPYSRFADGKAVLRSSIREYVVSEALNGLGIPTTRALSLTLLPHSRVVRERVEKGAIVARMAQSWLRIGTFDILRARGDRKLTRQLCDYMAEELYNGWDALPAALTAETPFPESVASKIASGIKQNACEGHGELEANRYTRLYRAICRANAKTVAAWQAYGFMNGVLNTDNTSLLGLSLDFGPFAFMDNFDPSHTPNHDDSQLRYAYRNQPSVIWWNLVRLGESIAELIGAGAGVDDVNFVSNGCAKAKTSESMKRAETLIQRAGEEYKAVFLAEYKRLMRRRLGLEKSDDSDFNQLFTPLLDILEACELDFSHFFRRLCDVRLSADGFFDDHTVRESAAIRFLHLQEKSGGPGVVRNAEVAKRLGSWLAIWGERVRKEGQSIDLEGDQVREAKMRAVNPKFVPRGWILDEIIKRVDIGEERKVLGRVMKMAEDPFRETWCEQGDVEARKEEERWCGDVPREGQGMQCSCSS